MEQKKSVPPPSLKRKRSSPTAAEASGDFASVLSDVTLDHKAHLFDPSYKMCRGKEEPQKKKAKVSVPSHERESAGRSSSGIDPPPEAPPSFLMEPPSDMVTGSPVSTSVERPALALLEPPAEGATLSELQHLLDELHKQIEEEKRQIEEKEEAIRLLKKDSVARQTPPSQPLGKTWPDPILMEPSPRTLECQSPAEETAKVWAGVLNLPTVTKFISRGYLVSASAANLTMDLPRSVQIGGQLMPQTVWDYVAKLKTSGTTELCVVRFQPGSEEEEEPYDSLFSYFRSRGQLGVVINGGPSIKNCYVVPLGAREQLPSVLRHLRGPGLDPNHPKLLLGVVVLQKTKCRVSLCQDVFHQKLSVVVPEPTCDRKGGDEPTTSEGRKALQFILNSLFKP